MRGVLCPYCGQVSLNPKRCDACAGYFDPLSRQASQNAMGPWYLRDARGPWRPGCSFETLKDLIRKGRVTRETVLRGPSTRQFWNFAGRTPTVANLLGICHNCGGDVPDDAYSCAACGAVFTPESDRQHLGLAPVHLLPGQAAPEIIAAASGTPERHPAAPRPVAAAAATIERRERRRMPGWAIVFAGAVVLLAGGVAAAVLIWPKEVRAVWEELTGTYERPASPQPAPTRTDIVELAPAATPPGPTATTESTEPVESPAPEALPTPAPTGTPDELELIRAILAAGGEFDERELLDRLEAIRARRPALAAEIDALADLVRKRAEQARARRLP